ncbi:sporulation histidine kinase inhibitor Sda [Gorillibacterium sp. sgz5001074]|uniref:sporulation histidine kinase inhibitor Sda n=1 Tax=Gorillibacterium sp. sgz5001074 TaxID=3446695 RepID=UPI003F671E73
MGTGDYRLNVDDDLLVQIYRSALPYRSDRDIANFLQLLEEEMERRQIHLIPT